MAGRPPGVENKNKRIKAALNRLADADPKHVDELVSKVWAMAMGGDMTAAREIFDRLDGKVPQSIGGSDELPPVGISQIERIIVDPGQPANPDGQNIQAAAGTGEI